MPTTPVRGKLYVAAVERGAGSPDAAKITLAAVTRGEENKSWAEATPMAKFEMTVQNPLAAARFVLGQEFYVDFTEAEPVTSLADPHEYTPSDYERDNGDKYGNGRCQLCQCKRPSHDEPLRSQLVKVAGLG